MCTNRLDFNHVSKNLSEGEVDKLKSLYYSYHRNGMWYKWKYKKLNRVRLTLDIVTTLVTTVGVVAGGVTMNPIILGCVSGAGILAQSYVTKSGIGGRVSKCKSAYVSYEKILSLIKSHLRGAPYEEHALLTELRLIDEIVVEQCPPLGKITDRYSKKFPK